MTQIQEISFIDNPAISDKANKYKSVSVDIDKVLDSWRTSLFSFEWVTPEGRIKGLNELPEHEKAKRLIIEDCVKSNEALAKPVLGIGLLENIEIGIGRHIFLTAAAHGLKQIPVHIPVTHQEDFAPYLFSDDK